MIQAKWDRRFLQLAMHYADWSKDPSTKCGAIIVDCQNRIVSTGYNGMAQGVNESAVLWEDRQVKYRHVIHAELNALIFAGRSLRNCTVYTVPIQPCSRCASILIQAGILRVVSIKSAEYSEKGPEDSILESISIAKQMYADAGVSLTLHNLSELGT